uniref:Interleukin 17d n=1 Tax=Sinocyclocheilus grahami TaxID=75366 RepID=A0A672SIG6_SINGR
SFMRAPRTRSCLDLPEEILEQMFGVLSAFHHTLQLAPPERQNLTCQSASRLALSPWAYRISHDPARYPRYLPEAKVRSSAALVFMQTGSCVGGRHSYTESYVSVAVGCTCVPLLEKDRKTQKSKPSVKRVSSKNSSTFRKNGLELIHF